MDIDFITQFLLAGIALFIAGSLVIIGRKRFELAIIGVALSPFMAAMLASKSSESEFTSGETVGSYARIGLLLLMGLIGLIKFLQHQSGTSARLPLPLKLLGAISLLAIVSTSYSIDWFYTLVRSVAFLALFTYILGLHAWLSEPQRIKQMFHLLFFVLLAILIANAASLIVLRESAWWIKNPSRFIGWWGHPNTMGAFCMICYPIALWKLAPLSSWKKSWVLLFIMVTASLHLITGSRSSIIAALLGIVTWFFVTRHWITPMVLSIVVASFVMLLIETTPIERSFERTVNTDRSVTTLTGRSEFWIESLKLIIERPLLGYGFGTAGKILAESELYHPEIRLWSGSAKTSLHNGYLTIASGVGVFGAIVWILILVMPLWRLRPTTPLTERAVIMAILFSCLLLNFVEDAINPGTSLPALIFWMAWTIGVHQQQPVSSTVLSIAGDLAEPEHVDPKTVTTATSGSAN